MQQTNKPIIIIWEFNQMICYLIEKSKNSMYVYEYVEKKLNHDIQLIAPQSH